MDVKAVLNLLAKRQINRFLGSDHETRPKLGNHVDIYSFQERTLGALVLSPSMGPVLFEAGKKVAIEAGKQAIAIVSQLSNYRSFAKAANLEEATHSTEYPLLQHIYESTGSGLLKMTHFEKDKQIVFEVRECAECYATGNIGRAICYYLGGDLAGALESSLNRQVGFIESKCVAIGDPLCEFRYTLSKQQENTETGKIEAEGEE
jgi:predicted hydrocarbon binding protein